MKHQDLYTQLEPQLSPCPFCGQKAYFNESQDGDTVSIECEHKFKAPWCGAHMDAPVKEINQLIDKWNRRPE